LAEIPRDRVEGSYIAIYEEGTPLATIELHQQKLLALDSAHSVKWNYTNAILGYSGSFTPSGVDYLRKLPGVKYVEEDALAYASQCTTQNVGTGLWGLARIDQRSPTDLTQYMYGPTGSGVNAYVMDTGIRVTHQQFGGRSTWGNNFMGDGRNSDYHGHGTHCAGTIMGMTYGVAKGANSIAVKVLSDTGSGSYSGIIAGVDWVYAQTSSRAGRDVANMSLGGGINTALNDAVARLGTQILVAVAAGNSNTDARNTSPASAANVACVGSTGTTDSRSSFSNYGSTLEIFAPGENVLSCTAASDTSSAQMSGTSMASPHVAGVAAVEISRAGGVFLPQELIAELQSTATAGAVLNPGAGSPNLFLYAACP